MKSKKAPVFVEMIMSRQKLTFLVLRTALTDRFWLFGLFVKIVSINDFCDGSVVGGCLWQWNITICANRHQPGPEYYRQGEARKCVSGLEVPRGITSIWCCWVGALQIDIVKLTSQRYVIKFPFGSEDEFRNRMLVWYFEMRRKASLKCFQWK